MSREGPGEMGLTRREVLMVGGVGSAALATAFFSAGSACAEDEIAEFVKRHTGRTATESDRLHLTMPAVFPTGYTVPMDLNVDSPMTEDDYVKRIRVFAPENPLIDVAVLVSFHSGAWRACRRASAWPSRKMSSRSPR